MSFDIAYSFLFYHDDRQLGAKVYSIGSSIFMGSQAVNNTGRIRTWIVWLAFFVALAASKVQKFTFCDGSYIPKRDLFEVKIKDVFIL
jgi:hypothetical protein